MQQKPIQIELQHTNLFWFGFYIKLGKRPRWNKKREKIPYQLLQLLHISCQYSPNSTY